MTTDWIGSSSPGSQTQIRCNDNELVIGVLTNASTYVNAFGLTCAVLNSDGTLGAPRTVNRMGGGSGTDYGDACPSGEVVVSERGQNGAIVDQWGAACGGIDRWLDAMMFDALLPLRGGTGGGPFARSCPPGTFLHGLDYDVYGYPNPWDSNSVWRVAMECIPVIRTP
jgi:hypothetical protein